MDQIAQRYFSKDPFLKNIIEELVIKYKCHTVILYGSRARGDENQYSDYDLLGVREKGRNFRVTEKRAGIYLDIFIQSNNHFMKITEDHVYMKDAVVLFDNDGYGIKLAKKLNKLKDKKFKVLSDNEIHVRKVWLHKMFERAKAQDLEGNFRRSWLLEALLFEYFSIRKLQVVGGSKECFQFLKVNDTRIFNLYKKSLENPTDMVLLKKLVIAISGVKNINRDINL